MNPRYATDAKVRKAFKLARDGGIDPGGLELKPDGGIVILDRRSLRGVNDDGDEWEDMEDGDGGD